MAASDKNNVANKLATLQATFKQQLPAKIEKIDTTWLEISQNVGSNDELKLLHMMAHSLAGSGGTFGAMAVSAEARELEQLFKTLQSKSYDQISFSNEVQQKVNELLLKLKQAANNWEPSNIPFIRPVDPKDQRDSNLIFLAEDDELLAANMIDKLEQADYQVRYFVELGTFEKAFETEEPAAIIMDIVFKEGDVAGADIICRIKEKYKACPPVIFISVRDDMEVRLAAARAGACRYFHKPLNMTKLVQSLDGLTARVATKPFRILLIDDDESLLEYYGTVLQEAGMEVQTLSKPLDGLKALTSFEPDVVVLDVYMPECSGPELAQVIRQDDAWLQTPIMFLSTETDLNFQLSAMDLGGDDFLVKPVVGNHLVAAVVARAKRARWARRLNKDLLNTLRESEFQVITMDQHAIVSVTDTAGRIIRANDKFCEISGYTRSELIGQNHRLLKSGLHSKEFYQDIWGTISHGNVWSGTICNRKKSGEEYWVEATIVPFLDEKGKPYKYVSARTDITAVRENEERLHRSQVFANIGTWDWNIKTGEIYWSERIGALFGYGKEVPETTYENFIAAVHPDDRGLVIKAVNNCVEHNSEYKIEHRVIWPDGSIHWMQEHGDVVRNDAGEPLHMLGLVQDITKKVEAEAAMRESEEKYRLLFELSEEPMWVIVDDQFMMANQAAAEMLDYENVETLTGTHPSLLSPEYQPDGKSSYEKANEMISIAYRKGYHRFEWMHKKKNGVEFPVDVSLTRVPYKGQLALFCVWRDITKSKEAEDKLRDSEERFAFAVEGAGEGVWDWDMRSNEVQYSNIWMNMLGYEPFELAYNFDTFASLVHPDDMSYVQQKLQNYLEGKIEKYVVELRMRCKNGNYKWILSRGRLIGRDEAGNPMRMTGIHTDITKHKHAEQGLIDAREEAERANHAKSQFLSSMSHELRTPMNAIMGFGQLLKMDADQPLSKTQEENVDEIVKAGDHLLELINEILDLAKIESGRLQLSLEPVSLCEIVAGSVQLVMPMANKRGIEICLSFNNKDISFVEMFEHDKTIWADRVRFKQVLLNLLSNAVKYNSENGQVKIACIEGENNRTRISVIDQGVGLSDKEQSQLFKAFNRIGAEQSNIEGTGIGLVITKSIVELMNGSIGVTSQQGKGSTFWIELPNEIVEVGKNQKIDKLAVSQIDVSENLKKRYSVLYIEDNPANLRLVRQILGRRKNIHVWSAEEPILGLELAAEHNPDLILLDINLPNMSGYEVLSKLRQKEATHNTPVIAISANAMPRDIEKGLQAGFDDYITKPVDVAALLRAVDIKLSDSSN